jgi:YgiT-type zinc finger domain-containing protein
MMKDTSSENVLRCMECQAGQMRRQLVTYYTWMSEELITVPNFPAWICDVCGRREYDTRALNQLNLILSPNAGKATGRQRPLPSSPDSSPDTPRPSRRE